MELVRRLIESGTPIVTVEDHAIQGGFGANVVDACNLAGLDSSRIVRLGMPQRWIRQGSRTEQMEEIGIDAASIARTVRTLLDDTNGVLPDPASVQHDSETTALKDG